MEETSEKKQELNLILTVPNVIPENPNTDKFISNQNNIGSGLIDSMNPIITNNNQIDTSNQPIIVNQVNPLPIRSIPLSVINSWGSIPHNVICPYCNQNILTNVQASCNMGSCCLCFWLSCIIWAIILLCMGKEIGCADATHKCPNCKNVIGVYRSC